jgi:hypothetical protein
MIHTGRNKPLKLVAWIYALALYLYPPGFRREYAEEMQAVFIEALKNASESGQFSSARIILREFAEFPGNLTRQFWNNIHAWFLLPWQDQESLGVDISNPRSWLSAGVAGLPHLLYALALYLPLLVTNGLNLPEYRGPGLPMFWAIVAVMLLIAQRLRWPVWCASWVGYGLVFMLSQINILFPSGPLAFLAGILWLILAVIVLFWLTRRAWISGLLAILPVTPMWIWLTQQDSLSGSLSEAALYVSAGLMLSLAVIAIVRLGRWQTALLLILAVILATGMPVSIGNSNSEVDGSNTNYLFVLILTAPLWLMALGKHISHRNTSNVSSLRG